MLKHLTFVLLLDMKKNLICIFMNRNENFRNKWKIKEKSRGLLLTQLHVLVSQLLIGLEYQTLYQRNAKTYYSYLMVR